MNRWFVACLLLAVAAAAPASPELDAAFPRSTIVITAARACHHFEVWVAVTPAEQRRGLMHVRSLAERQGMLFVYEGEARRSMWMKNTFLPLDMLFVHADGTVSSIVTDTEPLSLRSIASRVPVRYVLELNAGVSRRLEIREGDRMLWSGDLVPPESQDGGD